MPVANPVCKPAINAAKVARRAVGSLQAGAAEPAPPTTGQVWPRGKT